MRRRVLFLFAFFSALAVSVWADNVLILTNPRSLETHVFRTGSYLVFELKSDNSMHEGFIRGITDSSIVFDDSQVALSQINICAGSTKANVVAGRVANAVGNSLLFAGTAVFDCGVDLILYNDYYYWPIGGTVWLAGAFIAGLGYAFDWAVCPPQHAVRVRNYRKWDASIVASGQQLVVEKQQVQQSDTTTVQPIKEKKKRSRVAGDDVYGD